VPEAHALVARGRGEERRRWRAGVHLGLGLGLGVRVRVNPRRGARRQRRGAAAAAQSCACGCNGGLVWSQRSGRGAEQQQLLRVVPAVAMGGAVSSRNVRIPWGA